MKKYSFILLLSILAVCMLSACGSSEKTSEKADTLEDSEKLSIVTTIFPEYDWVRQIVGDTDSAEITMLLDNGVDLHSYQPAAEDIVKISSCDLFLYVGGESDGWVENALAEASNPDRKVLNILDVLGDRVKEEEMAEGMETEEEEENDAPEYDEHVWLSLKNAQVLCSTIADTLSEIDPEHAETYRANAAAYREKLSSLDTDYADAVETGEQNTLLFGDRFPFRYLADDYGLNYYAAFAGCSAESEASFETIVFLANKVEELGLCCVMQLEGSDGKIAQTIIDTAESKDLKILTMDSMQSTTSNDVQNGASYLSIMEKNLEVLKEALK